MAGFLDDIFGGGDPAQPQPQMAQPGFSGGLMAQRPSANPYLAPQENYTVDADWQRLIQALRSSGRTDVEIEAILRAQQAQAAPGAPSGGMLGNLFDGFASGGSGQPGAGEISGGVPMDAASAKNMHF